MKFLQHKKLILQALATILCSFSTNFLFSDNFPSNPHIVIDGSGNQIAVWDVNTGTTNIVQSSIFTLSWSAATTISTTNPAFNSQIVMTSTGNAVAAWIALDSVNQVYCLCTATATPLGGWSAPTTHTATNEQLNQFDLKINSLGEAVLIWTSIIGNSTNVWTSTQSIFSGGWGTPTQLF